MYLFVTLKNKQTQFDLVVMIFFLGAAVSFLAKNLTAFLIVEILIDGYMLIASTDAIVTLSIFTLISSSTSFRSDAWTMETRDYFTFALSNIIFIPRYLIFNNVAVKFIA